MQFTRLFLNIKPEIYNFLFFLINMAIYEFMVSYLIHGAIMVIYHTFPNNIFKLKIKQMPENHDSNMIHLALQD